MAKKLTTEDLVLNIIVNSNKAQSDIGKVSRELQDAKSKSSAAEAEMKKLAKAGKETSSRYKELQAEVNRYNSVITSSKIRLGELNQSLRLQDKSLKQLESSLSRTRQLWRQATNDADRRRYSDELDLLNKRISQLKHGSAQTGSVVSELTGRFGFLTSGVAAGIAVVSKLFSTNLRMEPINQALLIGSSNADNFSKNMEFLRETSERLGLEFISTATAFKQWQGAAKFSNLTAEETRDIFESVANAGAKMKLSNEQVEGTFLALSQMLSKGKVQAEELRGQLGERLPGAFALAAKAMGVTEQELNKMLEKGEVVADEFLPRFAKQLDISFGADKTEHIEGMQAATNRLSNEFDALWQSDRASSFFTIVIDGFARMFKDIRLMVNSKSWAEFKAIAFGGQAEHAKYMKSQRPAHIQAVDGFSDLTKTDQESQIAMQTAAVKSRASEYNAKSDKENLSRLTLANDTLAEMNKIYYEQHAIKTKIKKVDTDSEKNNNKAETAKRKAYRKELDDAEKQYHQLLQKEGLFRSDLSELTDKELENLARHEGNYQSKIDTIHNKYGKNLKTITQTAESELDKRKKAQEKYRQDVINSQKSLTEQEKLEYDERLKKAGLFGVGRQEMTKQQQQAFEALQKEHQLKIDKIEDDAIKVDFDQKQKVFDKEIAAIRVKHNNELADITTLDKAKEYLRSTFSDKELKQITSLDQARKLIQNQQFIAEEKLTKDHLVNLASLLQQAIATGSFGDVILSDEQKEKLKDNLLEVETLLSKIFTMDKGDGLKDKNPNAKMDVLGMTAEDWEKLFQNLKDGKIGVEDILSVLEVATLFWTQYNKLVENKENAQLQKDEAANNKKKENLKNRLDQGAISQESYNKQVEKLDKQMEKKKAVIARDQAKRERNVALMSSVVNTAKAVTAVLPNFILAAIVGAFGALQVATIASTPLPEIPGAEGGGQFLQVIREQDGKKFNAKADPKKRGYVSNPTVLVGENGKEWVANAQAVENPTVKPILDVLDTAQRNGTINTLNLSDIIAGTVVNRSMPGRAQGGSFSSAPSSTTVYDPQMVQVLKNLQQGLVKLDDRLANLKAEVSLLGRNGFVEKMDELNNIQNQANL